MAATHFLAGSPPITAPISGAMKAVSVAEADEYDRSFWQLSPDMAVITSMDPDHLDIYGTAENLQDAFVQFANRLKEGGYLRVQIRIAADG